MTRAKKVTTVLAHKKASVSLMRTGLSIDIADIPAEDAGLAAKELLDVMRTLCEKMGYDELIPDAGGAHSNPIDQDPEEDGEDFTEPPTARRKRPMGFR